MGGNYYSCLAFFKRLVCLVTAEFLHAERIMKFLLLSGRRDENSIVPSREGDEWEEKENACKYARSAAIDVNNKR